MDIELVLLLVATLLGVAIGWGTCMVYWLNKET